MNLQFFILIILLKNVYTYKPNRKIQSISSSKTNKPIDITPARYKVANKKTHQDAIINQEAPVDYFPDVEFPVNLMESRKPFYVSTSPFPKDVQATFDLITSKIKIENHDCSAMKDEIAKAKDHFTSLLQKETEALVICDNKTDVNTSTAPIITWSQNETTILNFEDLFTNWTVIEESLHDVDYILDLIKNLDELITNLNKIEVNFTSDDQNPTANECFNDMQNTFEGISTNNESVIELNGNSFPIPSKEQKQSYLLFDTCDLVSTRNETSNMTLCLVTNESEMTTHIDTEESFCEIGKAGNEVAEVDLN